MKNQLKKMKCVSCGFSFKTKYQYEDKCHTCKHSSHEKIVIKRMLFKATTELRDFKNTPYDSQSKTCLSHKILECFKNHINDLDQLFDRLK